MSGSIEIVCNTAFELGQQHDIGCNHYVVCDSLIYSDFRDYVLQSVKPKYHQICFDVYHIGGCMGRLVFCGKEQLDRLLSISKLGCTQHCAISNIDLDDDI